MTVYDEAPRAERLLEESAAVRDAAACLRASSARAREAAICLREQSRAARRCSTRLVVEHLDAVVLATELEDRAPHARDVVLDVDDLGTILRDNHGFSDVGSMLALFVEMERGGYPSDRLTHVGRRPVQQGDHDHHDHRDDRPLRDGPRRDGGVREAQLGADGRRQRPPGGERCAPRRDLP